MIVIVDNYDSFVWNIYHRLPVPCGQIRVVRNDEVTASQLHGYRDLQAVIISPGPMGPDDAGASNSIISEVGGTGIPILGICLGHQCIGAAFGCRIDRHPYPTHGEASAVTLAGHEELFSGLPSKVELGRYHSLHISAADFNHDMLRITARLDDGTIMGVAHRYRPIYGLQFHPESVLSGGYGTAMLGNFIKIVTARGR